MKFPTPMELEVRATGDLRPQILKALEEIRKEKPHLLEEGTGWRVNVADDSGQVLFSLALDDPADGQWLS